MDKKYDTGQHLSDKLDRAYYLLTVIRSIINDDLIKYIEEKYDPCDLGNTLYYMSISSLLFQMLFDDENLKSIIDNPNTNYNVGYDFHIERYYDRDKDTHYIETQCFKAEFEMIEYNKNKYQSSTQDDQYNTV